MTQVNILSSSDIDKAIASSILSSFPTAAYEKLISDAFVIKFPMGSVLYRGYDPPRTGLIVSGLVRHYWLFPDGKQVSICYSRTGDLLGVPTVINGPWSVNVHALMETQILVLNTSVLQILMKTDAVVCWATMEHVNQRFCHIVEDLVGNTYGSARKQIARHLLQIAITDPENQKLIARVSHQEIADAIGTARETVSRTIHQIQVQGILETRRGYIVILNAAGLHDIAWPKYNDTPFNDLS